MRNLNFLRLSAFLLASLLLGESRVLVVPHLGHVRHEKLLAELAEQLWHEGVHTDVIRTAGEPGGRTLSLQSLPNTGQTPATTVVYSSRAAVPSVPGYGHVCGYRSLEHRYLSHQHSNYWTEYCRSLIGDRALLGRLRRNGYRLVVVDMLCNECAVALARLLRAPLLGVWLTPLPGTTGYIESLVGDKMAIGMRQQLSRPAAGGWRWPQLISSTWLGFRSALSHRAHHLHMKNIVASLQPRLDYEEALRQLDVTLINTNYEIGRPLPLPPHLQVTGCVQCRPAPGPSQQIYQRLMNRPVGCGLSTVVVSARRDWRTLAVVRKLCQTATIFTQLVFLMSDFENDDDMKNYPICLSRNFHTFQSDLSTINALLGGNTTLLHIHSGLLDDVMLSAYHAVPSLAIVDGTDEAEMCSHAEQYGHVICQSRDSLSPATLTRSLIDVIYQNTYRQAARHTRQLWLENENHSPITVVMRWLERKTRFGSFSYLIPVDGHLNLTQYWMLDVMAFLGAVGGVGLALAVQMLRILFAGLRESVIKVRTR